MSIGGLPPNDLSPFNTTSYAENSGVSPPEHRSQTTQTAHPTILNALANTANHTAEDTLFNQREISVANQGLFGGTISYVASFFGAASQVAVKAAAYATLPAPGIYKDKIALARQALYDNTGADIAAETAKVIAKRQIHKFTYFLSNLQKLSIEDAQTGSLKNFLTVQGDKVVLSFKGESFLTVLKSHTSLLEETFEVNILRAMNNGIVYLKRLQEENPFFLVELAQQTLKQIVNETHRSPESDSPIATEIEHDDFMDKLQHHIVKALFPHGQEDIDIPLDLQGLLTQNAFLQIQEKALPRKMAKVYDRATSEATKYKILARAVQELKTILTTPPEEKIQQTPQTSTTPVCYPKQAEFNKGLLDAVSAFIDHIDSKLLRTLKPQILKKVKEQGPVIVEKLVTIDFNTILNNGLSSSCKKLSPNGRWGKKDDKDVFYFVPSNPKTRLEHEAHDQELLGQHQVEVKKSIDVIASDLNGLISRLATTKAKNHKSLGHKRLTKIKDGLNTVSRQIRKGLIRFAFKVFRVDKRITTLSQQVLELAEKLDLKRAAKPLKKVILKKE